MNRRKFLASAVAAQFSIMFSDVKAQNEIYLPVITKNYSPPQRVGITSDLQTGQIFPSQINRPVEFWLVPGDITYIDFSDRQEAEARWQDAIQQLNGLGKPFYAIPGNHDWAMQSTGLPFSQPTQLARELWASYIGPTQFVVETDAIKFIGLDYYDWSSENQGWLYQQLQTSKRRVVLSHYPLMGCKQFYDRSPGVWWDEYHASKLQFMLQNSVDLFISGHRHQFSIMRYGTMTHIICPALFSVVDDNTPEAIPEYNLLPYTLPTRGWLEITGCNVIELFRSDGEIIGAFGW